MTSTVLTAGLVGVVMAGVLSGLSAAPAVAATGINHQINFQGKVVNSDGTNVTNGSYGFVFKLYTVSSAGTAIWTESDTLTVTDGIFQVNLGAVTALPGSVDFNTDSIYLGINFNTDGEMTPRIQFTAAAYAFNSDALGGIGAAGFAQINPSSAQAGSLNIGTTVQAGTSLQAPLVDTASAVQLKLGTGTASSVLVGRATSSNAVTIQGSNSSTWVVTGASGTTTLAFAAPTATNTITFPNAGGTVCTTVATTCSSTYQAASSTGYILKNAADTSSATTLGSLLGLTNTNTGAAGVLSLANSGTNSALLVTQSGNPTSGQAAIQVNDTAGTPTGNLIDLQVATVSKFSVSTTGAVTTSGAINGQTISSAASFTGTVTAATSLLAPLVDVASAGTLQVGTGTATGLTLGKSTFVTSIPGGVSTSGGNISAGAGTITSGAINGQTISSAAAFTGTVSVVTSLQAPLLDTADSTSATTAAIALRSGNASVGTNLSSGSVTIDSGTHTGSGTSGAVNIGTTNAGSVGLGRSGAALTIQGTAASTLAFTSGTFTTTLAFTTPTANNTISFPNAGGTVCTTVSSTCSATYQAASAGGYILKNAQDTSSATTLGSLLGLTNTNTGAAGVLSLANSGTNSALSVTQSGNPTSGQAGILLNDTAGTPTGNLLDLQVATVSKFSVSTTGAVTTAGAINSQTISSAASFTGTVTAATSFLAPLVDVASAGTLQVGTGTATGLTLGKSSFVTSIPGGLSTSNANVNAGTGTVTGGVLSAASETLTSTSSTTVTAVIQGNTSGSADILDVKTGSGGSAIAVSQVGEVALGNNGSTVRVGATSTTTNVNLLVNSSGNAYTVAQLRATASQTGNLLEFADSTGLSMSKFNSSGQLILGRPATTGTGYAGNLSFADGSLDGFSTVITSGTLTSSQTLSLGNQSGTLCLQTSVSCGFATGTAGSYIQNQNAGAQTSSNFNISGSGTANSFLTPTVDVASAGTLSVATGTATGLTLGKSSFVTSIPGGVSTSNANINAGTGTITSGAINGQTISSTANFTGSLAVQGTAGLTLGVASSATGKLTFANGGGTGTTSISIANQTLGPLSLTIPNDTSAVSNADQLCLSLLANCSAVGAAGGDLGGTYPNPTIASLQGKTLTVSSTPATGSVLQYNGSAFVDGLVTNSNLTSGAYTAITGTGALVSGSITSFGTIVTGNTITGTTINGTTGINTGTGGGTNRIDATGNLVNIGTITSGLINGQTISSTANFTGTVGVANTLTVSAGGIAVTGASTITGALAVTTSVSSPLFQSADTTAGSTPSVAEVIRSGNASGASSNSGSVTVDSGTHGTGATSGAVNIGNTNASAVNIGRVGAAVSIQGSNASTIVASNGTNTTTVGFVNPTANVTYNFGAATANTYTICTTFAASCSSVYQAAGSYIAKNAVDTSSAAVTAGSNLLTLTNSAGNASGVLKIDNGSNSNSALSVVVAANPTSGQALIFANNTTAGASGNLIDLQANSTSKFSVTAAGAVTSASTINGQTISAAASFTGTVTAATGLTVSAGGLTVTGASTITGTLGGLTGLTVASGGETITAGGLNVNSTGITNAGAISGATTIVASTGVSAPLFQTADTTAGSTPSTAEVIRSGNASGASSNSGSVTVDSGTHGTGATSGAVNVGNTNASAVNIGNTGAAVSIQGSNASSIVASNGTTATTVNFANPTANSTYTFGASTTGSYTICTTYAASCSSVYQAAGSYIAKNAVDTSSAAVTAGSNLLTLTNSAGNASGVLKLDNGSNSNSTLVVTSATNPTSGQALIFANNTNGTPSGNLIDLQAGSVSKFSVSAAGAITNASTINGQTISAAASFTGTVTAATGLTVSAGGITVTGASTITGTLGGLTGLTVASGGETITAGGLNVNSTGITNAGAISGASTIAASTSVSAPTFESANSTTSNTSAVFYQSGNASVGTNLNSGAVTVDSGTHTGIGTSGAVNVGTTNASAINLGRTGAALSIQGSNASTIVASNGTNTTTVGFTSPTANSSYNFGASTAGAYTICTTYALSCSSVYQAAGTYLAKNATDTSSAAVAVSGNLLTLTNSAGNASGVLKIDNGSNTNSALTVVAAANPTSGQALIFANDTNGTPSGNLIDLQAASVSKFSVSAAGAVTSASTINGQTISAAASFTGTVTAATGLTVSAGGLTVTGASTITGTLGGLTGLTVASGGESINGGTNENNGGITNAGAIAGATTIVASTSVTTPILDSSSTLVVGGTNATSVQLGHSTVAASIQGTNITIGSAGNSILKNMGATYDASCTYTGVTGATTLNTAGKTPDVCTSFVLTDTAAATITVPAPAAGAGSVVYVSNSSSSTNPFTFASPLNASLSIGSTATLVYNGTAWTFAGADASGLQTAYNNSAGAAPSIVENTTNKAITVQSSATSGIAAGNELFGVRAAAANDTTLGNSILTVSTYGLGVNLGTAVQNPATSSAYDLQFGGQANRTIAVIDQATAATAGASLTIKSAAGNTSGAGGALTLDGGTGGTSGIGGAVVINGGAAGGGNTAGGGVQLNGGSATGTGTGGSITIQGGTAGPTSAGAGGSITLQGANGSAATAGGAGGSLSLLAGDGTGTGNNSGGNVGIESGIATGSGTAGHVTVKNDSNSTTGFQVQNASSVAILNIDTSSNNGCLQLGNMSGTVQNYTTCTAQTNGNGTVIINSGTANYSGLAFANLNSTDINTSNTTVYGQLLGIDSSGNVGLSNAAVSLTSPALAYWDGANNPTVGSNAYPTPTATGSGTGAVGSCTGTWAPAFVSGSGMELNPACSNTNGSLNWAFAQVPFEEVQFQYKAGTGAAGADATWFYSYANAVPTTEYGCTVTVASCNGTQNMGAGYLIYFSEYWDCIGVAYGSYTDGNQCKSGGGANPLASYAFSNGNGGTTHSASPMADGSLHDVDIQFFYNQIIIRFDGQVLISYADTYGRSTSNQDFGFGSRSGGSVDTHFIKGLLVTKLGTNTSQYNINNNDAPLASNMVWANSFNSTAITMQQGALGVGTSSPNATLDVEGTTADYTVVTNAGTVCQSNANNCTTTTAGTVVHGVGTNFQSYMIGDKISFADGFSSTITGVTSTTQLAVTDSHLEWSNNTTAGEVYTIYQPVFTTAGVGSPATYNTLQVGSSSSTSTQQTLLVLGSYSTYADTATCATTTNQGALYYNNTSAAIRGCVNGSWEDVITTSGLGLLAYGIVPDSGTTASQGDLAGTTGLTAGPCKVSNGTATNIVSWTACTAYSGGRKVLVTAGTLTATNGTANNFQHLCLTGTNGQPALSTAGAETANLATVSFPSAGAPIVCLADIKFAAANNTITDIYDTRTFTTTQKEFATVITNAGVLGAVVVVGSTTPGAVTPGTTVQAGGIQGVIVASTGSTSTTTVNAIVAISGPAWAKAITETGNAVGNTVQTTATTGYAGAFSGPTVTNTYSVLGLAETAWTGATACAANSDACAGSVLTQVNPR